MNTSRIKEILSKRNLLIASIFIIISSIIGFSYNWMLPDSLPFVYQKIEPKKVDDSQLFGKDTSAKTINAETFLQNTKTNDSIGNKKVADSAAKVLTPKNENDKVASAQKVPAKETIEIKTVTFEQMQKIVKSTDFVIIDARNPEQFAKGHIPNSINIFALDSPDNKVPKIYDIQMDKKIIIYCDGGNCDLSHELAKELLNIFGFKEVFIYSGGWEEWSKH
jgi:rhodanese-related sulfurtransferase